MPVVAETFDGYLNDVNGFHVKPQHVWNALESAGAALPSEGAVGGGTGMVCYGCKGGIRTSSRRVGPYTVGALVQCNWGRREELRIAGAQVGEEIARQVAYGPAQPGIQQERGSIIIVVATDAPLLPHQLKRLARRASLGLARTGSVSSNYSGDIFIAFSTANNGRSGLQRRDRDQDAAKSSFGRGLCRRRRLGRRGYRQRPCRGHDDGGIPRPQGQCAAS